MAPERVVWRDCGVCADHWWTVLGLGLIVGHPAGIGEGLPGGNHPGVCSEERSAECGHGGALWEY